MDESGMSDVTVSPPLPLAVSPRLRVSASLSASPRRAVPASPRLRVSASHRLTRRFSQLRKDKRCGLIAYVTCGDPDVETTVKIVLELEKAGADAIELGIPFSDPIAD